MQHYPHKCRATPITTKKPCGIHHKAFSYASITSIILPETLHRIEGSAFLGAGITSVIIPKDVEYIGTSAFGNCKKLKEIFFLGDNYPDTNYYTGAEETYPFKNTFATFKI